MPKPPFINLFDIAGITMITIVLSALFAFLAFLSHTSEYFQIPLVLIVVFM